MSERDKLINKRKASLKVGLYILPFSLLAVIILWASIQQKFLNEAWAPPSLFQKLAPELSFSEPLNYIQIIYAATLFIICLIPIFSIQSIWYISNQLWDAEKNARKRRLEDES